MTSAHKPVIDLRLGEWACLGLLCPAPTHGFAIAARLKPTGDVGRVWSLSRALTYRALDQLVARGLARTVGEEPGIAGGNRTILAATRSGREQLRRWLATPVDHLRDLRSELLLKLVVADVCGIDVSALLERQHDHVQHLALALSAHSSEDVVSLWRIESSNAALRFLTQLREAQATSGSKPLVCLPTGR